MADIKKPDLIKQLIEKHNYTKQAATSVVDDFVGIILDNLRQGNTISLRNFGIFDLVERKARRCPNPITGETCEIPKHWVPRFFPSKRMRMMVKMWEDDEKRGLK